MYFSIVPNISYDEKPIKYPFSEADFITAKNFFRRHKITDESFPYAVYLDKYTIVDGERPDTLALKLYGNQFYDWVILLTNNLVNAQYDWPMSNYMLTKVIEKEFVDPYSTIHHYETYEIGPYNEGFHVDQAFYNKTHKLNINGDIVIKPGNEVCRAVTVLEYYSQKNEEKRKIYLLQPRYLQSFVDEFRRTNLYKKSGNYVSETLKQTG